jgi:peptidoglycan hydrolase CwlO-like protein
VLGVAAVLVLIGGGLGYKMYSQHQQELAKVEAEKDRIAKEAAKAKAELQSRIAGIEKDMNDKLARAGSDAERERIRAEAAQAKMAAQQNRAAKVHQPAAKTDTPQPVKYKKVEKRDIPDDPTLGL